MFVVHHQARTAITDTSRRSSAFVTIGNVQSSEIRLDLAVFGLGVDLEGSFVGQVNRNITAAIVDLKNPYMKAAVRAYERGWGATPIFTREGGSIPVVSTFQRVLSIPTVLMGFALPDDHIHAPNEKFHLLNFYKGIETCIWFVWLVSRQRKVRTPVPAFKRGEPIEASWI